MKSTFSWECEAFQIYAAILNQNWITDHQNFIFWEVFWPKYVTQQIGCQLCNSGGIESRSRVGIGIGDWTKTSSITMSLP